jgi:hypothetical protein
LHVHGLEGHATLLDIGRDRIDDGVGTRNGGGDRGLVAHIGGDNRDPIETDRLQLNPRLMPGTASLDAPNVDPLRYIK